VLTLAGAELRKSASHLYLLISMSLEPKIYYISKEL
jgi:hypothetical protein